MFFQTAHHIFHFEDVVLSVFAPPFIFVKKRFGIFARVTQIAVILTGMLATYRVLWSTKSMRNELGVLIFHALNHQCLFLEVMTARCVFIAKIEFIFNFLTCYNAPCVTCGKHLHGEQMFHADTDYDIMSTQLVSECSKLKTCIGPENVFGNVHR